MASQPTADVTTDTTVAPAPVAAPANDASDFYRDTPADVGADGQGDTDVEHLPEAEPEPIPAPLSWASDAKEIFGTLPREAQEAIAKREGDREKFVQSKSREAVQARQAVEQEARQAFITLQTNHAAELQRYASQFQVPEPDARLLDSEDPSHHRLYMQQDAAYRHGNAQRMRAQQEANQAQQRADALAEQEQQMAIQAEVAILSEKIPEWSDPSARAKLLSDLQPIAAELGYSPEVMAQARAADILALRHVSELKAKASKYDQLMKTRMEPVRLAKQIPPAARAVAPAGQAKPTDLSAAMYPDDVRRN